MLIVFYSLTKEKKENNAIKHFYSNNLVVHDFMIS